MVYRNSCAVSESGKRCKSVYEDEKPIQIQSQRRFYKRKASLREQKLCTSIFIVQCFGLEPRKI